MNFNAEVKDQVAALLRSGEREQAKKLLQQEYKISEEDAEQLVHALERENPRENLVKPLVGKAVTAFAGGPGGCTALVLKGLMIFFGLIALTLIGFGLLVYLYYNHFTFSAITVPGRVIEFQQNNEGSYAPLVAYEWEGESKQYQSVMYSNPPGYELNQSVTMLVNPENPDEAIIDSFEERYLIAVILASVGTIFLIITVVLYNVSKKLKRSFDKSA